LPAATKNNDFPTRVLVVDDEPVIITTMTAILQSAGHQVRTAPDGFAALKVLRETLPDVIISDLRMPGMSGFELLSIVRRRFPHIPVIAISGEYVAEGMPPGLLADAFYQKGGYTPEELFRKIHELVADGPVRPHLARLVKCPLWIPRRDAGYIVATCPECLRSFPVDDTSTGGELRTVECPSCGTTVEYLVDEAVLEALQRKQARLPQQ
jgi:predicted Zn finger-like uncharacterized protein